MRMKVSFPCSQIFLHIGSNFNGKFAFLTFLSTIALTAPHRSESAVVNLVYHGKCLLALLSL